MHLPWHFSSSEWSTRRQQGRFVLHPKLANRLPLSEPANLQCRSQGWAEYCGPFSPSPDWSVLTSSVPTTADAKDFISYVNSSILMTSKLRTCGPNSVKPEIWLRLAVSPRQVSGPRLAKRSHLRTPVRENGSTRRISGFFC